MGTIETRQELSQSLKDKQKENLNESEVGLVLSNII